MINHRSRIELARQATAILRAANCDTVTGEKKSSQQAPEHRIAQQRLREKRMKLGTLGAASPVRSVRD